MYDICDIMRPTKNTKMVMLPGIQHMGIQTSSLITITLLLIPYTLTFFRNPLRSITDFFLDLAPNCSAVARLYSAA